MGITAVAASKGLQGSLPADYISLPSREQREGVFGLLWAIPAPIKEGPHRKASRVPFATVTRGRGCEAVLLSAANALLVSGQTLQPWPSPW